MSLQFKLSVFFSLLLVVSFALFSLAALGMPLNIRARIDRELQSIASEALRQARATSRTDINAVKVPERLRSLEYANTFFVVVTPNLHTVTSSANISPDQVLDKDGFADPPTINTLDLGNESLRVLTVPVEVDLGTTVRTIGYLQVGQLMADVRDNVRLTTVILLLSLAALASTIFITIFLMPNILQPLNNMSALAVQLTSADDLSRRLPDDNQPGEIGQLTRAFNHLLERLENLFRTQQRFLADVSHELRTPLTTIRGNLDLMRYMGQDDPELLGIIGDELERMTRLVNNLLALARADVGGVMIQHERVELDTIFLDVYRQAQGLGRPVALELAEVDQVCVLGDSDRLKQVVLNLVDNALNYTPEGGRVTMSLTHEMGEARLTVVDTGIGIAPEDLPHIFDRFYRADKARTRRAGGSGLGLSIVQSIVAAHRGRVEVQSQVGQGSTFTVILPALHSQAIQPSQVTATVA